MKAEKIKIELLGFAKPKNVSIFKIDETHVNTKKA